MALSRPGDRGLASDPRQVTKSKRKCAAHCEHNGPADAVLTLGEAAINPRRGKILGNVVINID